MSNVKLAIRVRPFTEKECKTERDRVPVVNVVDTHTVTITNVKVSVSGAGDSRERVRRYYADYAFNSACPSTHPEYASQETVFETLGREVLSTLSRGQSACVLTYGQSATGKTHTMMGSPGQPGLVPRLCNALAGGQLSDITVSFLEIYNEKVHDLLAGEPNLPLNSLPRRKGNFRKDLRVREHPTNGPYVQNLRRVTVKDVESLLAIVSEGTRRRRTAATKRNSSSSRSHALLELATPRATLHLADLAGSEKGCWEGNTGGRQKEGANINKSLVALSNVISALVNGGSGRGRFVPYRDSALTWLLKDCFTGGGSTFIIATVSPSVASYGESASTLRWASRARRLPDVRANTSHLITKSQLQAQLNTVLAELARHFIQYKPETGQLVYDDKHWTLLLKNSENDVLETEVKIGNIMNTLNPQNSQDVRNSESTPSSIASGSSDVINNMDKNAEISNEINKEIDKLFGPALERTRSGIDMDIVVPLRHKKRHFRSQEVLSYERPQTNNDYRLSDAGFIEGEKCINDPKIPNPIPILYDNQRAEIIASVTERLYSKLKKNECAVKDEPKPDKKSLNELKIVQPLNELKICSNARQRLMEISKKALRNKRKIGIPAHTQTRKTVIRVKDQAVDIQTDLQPYINNNQKYSYKFLQDVSTETSPITPRLKEVAVGPNSSNLYFSDRSTITECKKVSYKNSSTITNIISTNNQKTQTYTQPVFRRKRRLSAYSRYIRKLDSLKSSTEESNQNSMPPIININISPMYAVDSDSASSDDVAEGKLDFSQEKEKHSVVTTPDLLTNHSNSLKNSEENHINEDFIKNNDSRNNYEENFDMSSPPSKSIDDFSDADISLPRVSVDGTRKVGQNDYKDLIFGRNEDLYPYNIKLSPSKEKNESKKLIRFKDLDATPEECCSNSWKRKTNDNISKDNFKKYIDSDFEFSDSSKSDSGSFVWKRSNSLQYESKNTYTQKKQNHSLKYDRESRFYKDTIEIIDLDSDSECDETCCNISDVQFSLNKQRNNGYNYDTIERKIKSACNSLEASVNKYDDYLANRKASNYRSSSRTPTEYLQHLIKLRRDAIKAECLE